jgi:hypothetical protein
MVGVTGRPVPMQHAVLSTLEIFRSVVPVLFFVKKQAW